MNKAFLIFPHQLFEANFSLSSSFIFVLVEDELYFKQYKFHQQKLIFHRASMQQYKAQLIKRKLQEVYFAAYSISSMENLMEQLIERNIGEIHYRDVVDDWLEQRISKACRNFNLKIVKHQSPAFLCEESFLFNFFQPKKHFNMAAFYVEQRKRFGILLNDDGSPSGGKWNFDSDNRKKLPNKFNVPSLYEPSNNKYVAEARDYVNENFKDNLGSSISFIFATNHDEARQCLQDFLRHRLLHFGLYEDAISTQHDYLFHAVLTPYLNTGLLIPDEVIDAALQFSKEVPINSLEGFIRQIIGWREFMRASYVMKGRKMRSSNFWNFKTPMSSKFYNGTTGIEPVDYVISKLNRTAYSHHIERLMVMGNFMLLCQIHPTEVYQWFMEMYIDAYDWVMVPNVYSMSQYSCGGLITTKPYISGSNYILKMSNFKKGDWCSVWDGLYWRFINENKSFFLKNPRLSMMARLVEQMDESKLKKHYDHAERFLSDL